MKTSIAMGLKNLPGPQGERFFKLMAGGSMRVEVYAPQRQDLQQPHSQDELYFIHSGRGQLIIGEQVFDCAAGDAFHVAAGVSHRFIDFSDDFVTWVVFYGPQGGE